MAVQWDWHDFGSLDSQLAMSIYKLRQDVFIVEQDVPYVDIDGKDPSCLHLTGMVNNELLAYMRVVPLDLFEKGYWSFGRVITRPDMRRTGLGRRLVAHGIQRLDELRGRHPIKISSQLYLKPFYTEFGFAATGDPYIEDRIPHIAMIRP